MRRVDTIWRNALALQYLICILTIACSLFFFASFHDEDEIHLITYRAIFVMWAFMSVILMLVPSVPGIALNKQLEDLPDKVYRVLDPYASVSC